MSALEGASTSQDNDGGSEALITYMQSHSNPQVELFSASVLNEWLRSSEKMGQLSELCIKCLQSRDSTVSSSLMYLCHVIQSASPDVVYREYKKWTSCIQQNIVSGLGLHHSYAALKSLLNAIRKCPEANREFSTGHLPTMLSTLMSFRRTKSQASKVTGSSLMACVSACIHYYPFVIGQHYTALYSWAIEGLASVDTAYSQEASRLLALLSTDTPSWDKTVHKLCDELNFLTTTGFAPATTQGVHVSASVSSSIFPPLPTSEPQRIATISLYYQSVARSLVYLLSFRLSTPVNIPSQLLMTTICQPFTMLPDRLGGRHALELLLLKSALPIFYSTMFITLEALIKCAGTHLLPYSTVINQLFVHTLTWTAQNNTYQDLRCVMYRCISTWLATNKYYGSCDHLVSMVINDTGALVEETSSASVITAPKRKKRKFTSRVTTSELACNKPDVNQNLVMAALSAVNRLLQFCGPVMISTSLEDLEHHMIKLLSHDHHSASIKMILLHCVFHLINTSCYQYTPPVSWVIAMITRATHSDNDQVKLTALQLINQCDLTVMSSFVPHPPPVAMATPQSSGREKQPQAPSGNADKPGAIENNNIDDEQGELLEIIMIDDMSSNEGVTMETAVTTGDGDSQAVVSPDGSHDSPHIDLDQDDDVNIVLEKFVDQSSDSSE